MTILTKTFGYFRAKKILDILVKSTMIRFTFLDAHQIKRKGTKRMKSMAEDFPVPWNTYLKKIGPSRMLTRMTGREP